MQDLLSKKFIILIEIATGDYYNLGQIAEKVGITKQGVSEYLKKMREEGLIEIVGGKYKATIKGIEKLFSYINQLEKYIKDKRRKLNIMEYCSAIAGENIERGEKVFLFMKDGYLYAYTTKKSGATAEAIENAKEGEDIAIRNVRGIIKLDIGKIYIFSLPSILKGGSKIVNFEEVKEEMEKLDVKKIGILDIIGKVALNKMKKKYDIEYCPIQSAIEASQKGLNVLLVGGEEEAKYAIRKIEEYNENAIEKIKYEIFRFSK